MLLLDANVVAWWFLGDTRLGPRARAMLSSSESLLVVSLLTLFELELKISAGRLKVPGPVIDFLETYDVAVYSPSVRELPEMLSVKTGHSDPYDRSLVGLGVLKGWDVMTSDRQLIGLKGLPIEVMDSRE